MSKGMGQCEIAKEHKVLMTSSLFWCWVGFSRKTTSRHSKTKDPRKLVRLLVFDLKLMSYQIMDESRINGEV